MSRVGKKPLAIPDKVQVVLKDGALEVQGILGRLTVPCNSRTTVDIKNKTIRVKPKTEKDSPFQGLMRALIANAVEGVTKGFQKQLQIVGVGYRAEVQNKALKLFVGLSHPVVLTPPETIEFAIEVPTNIGGVPVTVVTVKGIDKQLVGSVAARIRAVRPPEPYKGKGIKYSDEFVRRKPGKAAAVG